MKRITVLFVAILMFMLSALPILAHVAEDKNGKDGHNSELEQVLFGDKNFKRSKSQEIQDTIKAIEYASYLTLDQFNGSGEEELKFLKEQGIPHIPKNIAEIDFSGNYAHRSYTHRGWDFVYSDKEENKAHWKTRKKILLNTINHEFDFGFFSNDFLGFNKKCNSFAALVYYVHVLGDYVEDGERAKESGKYRVNSLKMDFGGRTDKDTDLIQELTTHFEILFDDQTDKQIYKDMVRKMKEINATVKQMSPESGFETEEEIAFYYGEVDKFLQLLYDYVPKLLKREEFFQQVFYPE